MPTSAKELPVTKVEISCSVQDLDIPIVVEDSTAIIVELPTPIEDPLMDIAEDVNKAALQIMSTLQDKEVPISKETVVLTLVGEGHCSAIIPKKVTIWMLETVLEKITK